MGKRKGGKKKGKTSAVASLKKVAGDLSQDRVNILLFGFPTDYNADEDGEGDVTDEGEDNIVKKKRFISPETEFFSNKIAERAASPVVSPRYGISGEDETAWKPYYGKAKSFKDITKDCKEWSKRIRQTLEAIKAKNADTESRIRTKSTGESGVVLKNQEVVKRIKNHLPDASNSDSEVVIDLMELSDEMAELRQMLTLEKAELKNMNISADVIERILFESTQLGHSADQVRLLDIEHNAAGFAKNLRGIWELLYLRATGKFLPSAKKEVDEVEELQLRTVDSSFVRPLSAEELNKVSVPPVEEDTQALMLPPISDILSDDENSLPSQNVVQEEESSLSRTSVVLQKIINEANSNIQEPAVVPITTFNFDAKLNNESSESLKGLSVGFKDDVGSIGFQTDGSRCLESYNEILERRTTVYDGKGASSSSAEMDNQSKLNDTHVHLHGSFNVNAVDDEIDEHMQAKLTKSSITHIEMKFSNNSSLRSAEEENWSEQQKRTKLELLTKIKAGNFFPLKHFRTALTPEPKRTVTTPRTPVSREAKVRRSKPVPVADRRPLFKQLKHVSVEFGFAECIESDVHDHRVIENEIKVGKVSPVNNFSNTVREHSRVSSRQGLRISTSHHSRQQSRQESRPDSLNVEATGSRSPTNNTGTRYLSSPKANDMTFFPPLSSYAANEDEEVDPFLSNPEKVTDVSKVEEEEEDDEVTPLSSITIAPLTKVEKTKTDRKDLTATVSLPKSDTVQVATVKVNDFGGVFSDFQQHKPKSPVRDGKAISFKRQGRQRSNQKVKDNRSSKGSSKSPTRAHTLTRSPSKSPAIDHRVLDEKHSADGIRNSVGAEKGNLPSELPDMMDVLHVHTEKSVQLPPKEISQQESVHTLDENSASTMFSIMVAMPGPAHRPPDMYDTRGNDAVTGKNSPAIGVAFSVSDSFAEENAARAMKNLTHRPIRRVSPRLENDDSIPTKSPPVVDADAQNSDDINVEDKSKPDEILHIVGNVSPRALHEEKPETHEPELSNDEAPTQSKQLELKKQTLKLSLPSAILTQQDSDAFMLEKSEEFEKSIKRTHSAASISDFNLSVMTLSVGDNFSTQLEKKECFDVSKLPKSTPMGIRPVKKIMSNVVSYSKPRSSARSNFFVAKYPVQVKGMECEEIFYDSQRRHIVITTINSSHEQISTIDMPIEDVIVTYGMYEGTLTLRCNSDAAPADYIATIKFDDWKRITAQVENGLKRNYAYANICQVTEEIHPPMHPETEVTHLPKPTEVENVSSCGTNQNSFQPEIKACPIPDAIKPDSVVSALQSFMDDLSSHPSTFDHAQKCFPSLANHTSSHHDLAFLSTVTNSIHADISGSRSSEEFDRGSIASKRNEKGAAPLPIIDDSGEDDHENVFLTGFSLKEKFSVHVEEQDPHDEIFSREQAEPEKNRMTLTKRGNNPSAELIRKYNRKFAPPMASRLIGDSDVLVDRIIEKFNALHPPSSDSKASVARAHDLFNDPLPRASTVADKNNNTNDGSFIAKPVILDENVVAFRQRTAPSRVFVAPDPSKPPPIVNTKHYIPRSERTPKPPSTPLTCAVLEDVTVPNPRRVTRGPDESTYRTLSAKRPPTKSSQSYKSPRSVKHKPTNQPNVFISNEIDENSILSKMMEVSSRLSESKVMMLRQVTCNEINMTESINADRPDTSTKIVDLKLAL